MSLTYDGIIHRSLEEQVRYDAEQIQLLKQADVTINEKIDNIKTGSTNLVNGTGTGSLVQKRLKSDGVTWTTAKAYQGASTAFGGGTQAGRTEEEFNSYFWDSSTNEPINGGQGKNSEGKILDKNGLTYDKSYSFSVAEGENTKALGRSSHSKGNATQAIGDCSNAEGLNTKAEGYAAHTEGCYTEAYYTGSHAEGDHTKTYREYQHVEGTYNAYKSNALFIVGNGTPFSERKNAFEVLVDGRAKVQSAPVDNDDVVRKADLANVGGGKLYKHFITIAFSGTTKIGYAYLTLVDNYDKSYDINKLNTNYFNNGTTYLTCRILKGDAEGVGNITYYNDGFAFVSGVFASGSGGGNSVLTGINETPFFISSVSDTYTEI